MSHTTPRSLLTAFLALVTIQTAASNFPKAPEWQVSKGLNRADVTLEELQAKTLIKHLLVITPTLIK